MAKRKWRVHDAQVERPSKVQKTSATHCNDHPNSVLLRYYPRVLTLRTFLLSRLPSSSRVRRRRLRDYQAAGKNGPVSILDSTLVGILRDPNPAVEEARRKEFLAFSQSPQRSNSCGTPGPPCGFIEEVSRCSLPCHLLPLLKPSKTT